MGEPIIILLLLFGLASASQLPNGCPADFSVHHLLRHETDCDKYYSCSNGQRMLMTCPSNTLFDYELQICNHAFAVVCETSQTTEFADTTTEFVAATIELTDTTTIEGSLPNGCPADFSIHLLLPHETDCDKFYSCSNGQKILFTCPGGTLFDFELQVCNWAHEVSCIISNIESTTTKTVFENTPEVLTTSPSETIVVTTSSITTASSARPEYTIDFFTTEAATVASMPSVCPDGFFGIVPHPLKCDCYYVCTDWDPIQLFCLPGHEFDPQLQTCVEITEGGCTWLKQQHTTTDGEIVSESTITDATVDINTKTTTFEPPTTPETTITTQETTITTNEAKETTFAPTTEAPITTTKETFTPETTTEIENEITTEFDLTSPSVCPDGFFGSIPHPEICESYYVCTGWDPIQLFCLPGFEFNSQLQACVEITEGGCTRYQQQQTTTESEISSESTESISTKTTAFDITTPVTTFDPTTEAQLTTNTEPATSEDVNIALETTTELNPTSPSVCPDGFFGTVPHPEICESYFVCTGWDPIQLFCIPGFEFDPYLQACVEISEEGCTWSQRTSSTVIDTTISDSSTIDLIETKPSTIMPPTTVTTDASISTTVEVTSEPTTDELTTVKTVDETTVRPTTNNIETDDSITVELTTEDWKTTESQPATPSICPDGYFGNKPHPDLCDAYYSCSGWSPILLFCSNGFEFDPVTGTCVAISEGGCTWYQTTTSTTTEALTETTKESTASHETVEQSTANAITETTQEITTDDINTLGPTTPEITTEGVIELTTEQGISTEFTTRFPTISDITTVDSDTTKTTASDVSVEQSTAYAITETTQEITTDDINTFEPISESTTLKITTEEMIELTSPKLTTTTTRLPTTSAETTVDSDITETTTEDYNSSQVTDDQLATEIPTTALITEEDSTDFSRTESTTVQSTTEDWVITTGQETSTTDDFTTAVFTTTKLPGVTVELTDATTEYPTTTRPICPDGFFGNVPHEERCDAYYLCSGWNPVLLFCYSGFEFDPVTGACVAITEGGCTWNQISSTSSTTSLDFSTPPSTSSELPKTEITTEVTDSQEITQTDSTHKDPTIVATTEGTHGLPTDILTTKQVTNTDKTDPIFEVSTEKLTTLELGTDAIITESASQDTTKPVDIGVTDYTITETPTSSESTTVKFTTDESSTTEDNTKGTDLVTNEEIDEVTLEGTTTLKISTELEQFTTENSITPSSTTSGNIDLESTTDEGTVKLTTEDSTLPTLETTKAITTQKSTTENEGAYTTTDELVTNTPEFITSTESWQVTSDKQTTENQNSTTGITNSTTENWEITTEQGTTSEATEGVTSTLCPDGYFGNVPHPERCDAYILCSGWNPIFLFCPSGYEFDSYSASCVVITEGGCTWIKTTTTSIIEQTTSVVKETTTTEVAIEVNTTEWTTERSTLDLSTNPVIDELTSASTLDLTSDGLTDWNTATVNEESTATMTTESFTESVPSITTDNLDITTLLEETTTPDWTSTTKNLSQTTLSDITTVTTKASTELELSTVTDTTEYATTEGTHPTTLTEESIIELITSTTTERYTTLANESTVTSTTVDLTTLDFTTESQQNIPTEEDITTIEEITTTQKVSTLPPESTTIEPTPELIVTTEEIETTTPTLCPAGYFGNTPHPEHCDAYYLCSGWNPILLYCPSGQEFDPVTAACVTIAEGGCTWIQTSTTAVTAQTNTEAFTSTTREDLSTTESLNLSTIDEISTYESSTASELLITTESLSTEDITDKYSTINTSMEPENIETTTTQYLTVASTETDHLTTAKDTDMSTKESTVTEYTTTEDDTEYTTNLSTTDKTLEVTSEYSTNSTTIKENTTSPGISTDTTTTLDDITEVTTATKIYTKENTSTDNLENTSTTTSDKSTTALENTERVTESTVVLTTTEQITTSFKPATTIQDLTTPTKSEGTTETLEVTTPAICPDGFFGMLANEEECDAYYMCSGWMPIPLRCPSGYEFDPDTEVCVEIVEGGCTWLSTSNVRPSTESSLTESTVTTSSSVDAIVETTTTEELETLSTTAPLTESTVVEDTEATISITVDEDGFTPRRPGFPDIEETTTEEVTITDREETTIQFKPTTEAINTETEEIYTTADLTTETTNIGTTTIAVESTTITLDDSSIAEPTTEFSQTEEAVVTTPALCPDGFFGMVGGTEECDVYYLCSGWMPISLRCPSGYEFSSDSQVCVEIAEGGCTWLSTSTMQPSTESSLTESTVTTSSSVDVIVETSTTEELETLSTTAPLTESTVVENTEATISITVGDDGFTPRRPGFPDIEETTTEEVTITDREETTIQFKPTTEPIHTETEEIYTTADLTTETTNIGITTIAVESTTITLDDSSIAEPTTEFSQTEEAVVTTPALCPDGFFGMVGGTEECDVYYLCSGWMPILLRCPSGYEFSSDSQECVPISEGSCTLGRNNVANINPEAKMTKKKYIEVVDKDSDLKNNFIQLDTGGNVEETHEEAKRICKPGFYENIEKMGSCNTFYMCIDGVVLEMQCLLGTQFDATMQKCAPISQHGCNANIIVS